MIFLPVVIATKDNVELDAAIIGLLTVDNSIRIRISWL
jgi:hypothetical protein